MRAIGRIGSATSARSAAFIEGLEVLKKIERLLLAVICLSQPQPTAAGCDEPPEVVFRDCS